MYAFGTDNETFYGTIQSPDGEDKGGSDGVPFGDLATMAEHVLLSIAEATK